jgi:hypothetical protein
MVLAGRGPADPQLQAVECDPAIATLAGVSTRPLAPIPQVSATQLPRAEPAGWSAPAVRQSKPSTCPRRRHRGLRADHRGAIAASFRRGATGPSAARIRDASSPDVPARIHTMAPPGPEASSRLAEPPSTYRRLPAPRPPRDADDHDALRLAHRRSSQARKNFWHSAGPAKAGS